MGVTEVIRVRGGIIGASEYAFREDIEHIVIRGDLRLIGEHAFYNCRRLKSVEYKFTEEKSLLRLLNHLKFNGVVVGEEAFTGTALRNTLYENPPKTRRSHVIPWKLNL